MEPGALIRKHPIDVALLCCLLCLSFFAANPSFSEQAVVNGDGWYAVAEFGWAYGEDYFRAYTVTGIGMSGGSCTEANLTYPSGYSPQTASGSGDPYSGAVIYFITQPGIWTGLSRHYVGTQSCSGTPISEIVLEHDATQVEINAFYANPTSILPYGTSRLTWATRNGTSITINGTSVSANGSMDVHPSATTNYVLAVSNSQSSAQAIVTVNVDEPLTPHYYRYNVRHEKGASAFFPYAQIEQESVNSANGNLNFSIPLISRPGRNGMGIDLRLAYNSKIWDFFVQNNTLYATIPEYDSWVGLGWTLTAGRIIDDSSNGYYYLTTSDGSNHTLAYSGGAWRSTDSSYMVYDPVALKLTFKNGSSIQFNYQDPTRPYMRYATRLYDANGNYISIQYAGTGGKISTIRDTLGNTYTFQLDYLNSVLAYIQYTNTNNTNSFINFTYTTAAPNFGSQATMDPHVGQQQMLTQIMPYFIKHDFTYNSSGQLESITYPTFGTSRYFYTKYTVLDRLLSRTVPDYYVTSHDTGAGTGTWTWNVDSWGQTAPKIVRITIPGRSTLGHYMEQSSPGWADGFMTKIGYYDSTLSNRTLQGWTQDDEQLATIRNPRPAWISTGKKRLSAPSEERMVRKEFSYAPVSEYSGNVKEIREYAFDQITLRRKTVLSYLHETNGAYTNLNILDRATSTLVYDGSNNLISKTVTAYDSFSPLYATPNAIRHDTAFGTTYLTRGLPTSVTRWHNIAQNGSITVSMKYDECGNVRETIDGRSYSTLTDYWISSADNAYAFPLRVVNAKSHISQATYSYKSGALLTSTDANGIVTTRTYDNFDRITQTTRSDGAKTTVSYVSDPEYFVPLYVEKRTYLDATNYVMERADLDGLGRLKEVTAPGNIKQDQTYSSVGTVKDSSLPHIAGQAVYRATYSDGGVATQTVNFPNGQNIQYFNEPNAVRVQSNDGKQAKYSYQEDGKIEYVLELDPATGELNVRTDYSYDALGRLAAITQGVQTRSFTYDDMGRLLTETYPETGTTSYVYDANSNVVLKTDSRGIVTSITYDELNRPTYKSYSDGTPTVSYYYDGQPGDSPITAAYPIGRLTRVMTTTSGITAKNFYSYCSCTSVIQESMTIFDGSTTKTYTTNYTHNLADQLVSIGYPNGKIVNYTRDSLGREIKVSSTWDGWRPFDYIYGATYGGPQGALTQVLYPLGSGSYQARTEYAYSPTSLQLTHMAHKYSLEPRYDRNFSYTDPLGRPTSRIYDATNPQYPDDSEHYEYDNLGRVTAYWRSPQRSDPPTRKLEFSYDRYGNITNVIVNQASSYAFTLDPSTNRLLSRVRSGGQTSYSYDAAGNAVSYGAFDAENRLTSRNGTAYLYDGNGRRFRVQGTSTINYIYSYSGQLLAEDNVTALTTDNYIYFNGQKVAIQGQQSNQFRLLLNDYKGSVRTSLLIGLTVGYMGTTQYSVITADRYSYDVWGQNYDASGQIVTPPSHYRYQDKERDGGLDYFGARHYEGGNISTGSAMRWISADPVTSNIYDPQSLNKYTYVRNDPVNLIDPDGRMVTVINPSVYQFFLSIGWTPDEFQHLFGSLPGFDIAAGLSYGFTNPDGEWRFYTVYGPAIVYANRSAVGGGYGGSRGSGSSRFSPGQSKFLSSAVDKMSDAINSHLLYRGCGEFMKIAASALVGFRYNNTYETGNLMGYDPYDHTIQINDRLGQFTDQVAINDPASFAATLAEEYYHAAQTAKGLYSNTGLGANPKQEYYATSFSLLVAKWVGASDNTLRLIQGNLDRWGQTAGIDQSQRAAATNCEIK